MKQFWSKDYNELHKNSPEEWKILSRKNRYKFTLKDGSIKNINYFCEKYGLNTIIDYGCGSAINHFSIPPNVSVYNYDPFVEEFKTRPNQSSDMVVCYNVLNVIEPMFFDNVLKDIYDLTDKVFICNIKIPGYWQCNSNFFIEKIASLFEIIEFSYMRDEKDFDRMNLFILSKKIAMMEVSLHD